MSQHSEKSADDRCAVIAESLYLANLMIAPMAAFLGLLFLYFKKRDKCSAICLEHMRQAINASVVGAALLLCVGVVIVALGGLHSVMSWTLLILYFTCVHATMILFGALALVKAMAGQSFQFPIVGSLASRWLR